MTLIENVLLGNNRHNKQKSQNKKPTDEKNITLKQRLDFVRGTLTV